jgi:hypothetical protein
MWHNEACHLPQALSCFAYFSTLETKAIRSSETSVDRMHCVMSRTIETASYWIFWHVIDVSKEPTTITIRAKNKECLFAVTAGMS